MLKPAIFSPVTGRKKSSSRATHSPILLYPHGGPQTDIKQIMAKNSAERDMQHLRANQSVNIRIDASGQVTDVQFFTDEELERNLVALEKSKANGRLLHREWI